MIYDLFDKDRPAGPNRPDASMWHALLEEVGLKVVYFEHYGAEVWDEYLEPRRERLRMRRLSAGSDPNAERDLDYQERRLESERPKGVWANYGVFITTKRTSTIRSG